MNDIFLHYCDNSLAVCEKPAKILSEGEGDTTLPSLLRKQLGGEIYPIHRLDRETTGLMVFARTKSAAADLSQQIIRGTLEKDYLAILCGVPQETDGHLCDLLFYDRRQNRSFVVKRERRGVKKAELTYEVIETKENRSLVRVHLLTGRTHQIRAQFSSRSLPLLGDRRYGAPAGSDQIALHSYRLSFCHPDTKERLCFSSFPAQKDFLLFSLISETKPIEKSEEI